MNPGLFVLVLPLLAGLLLARRLFGLEHPLQVVAVGLSGGWVAYTMLINLGLRSGISLSKALPVALLLLLALALLAHLVAPKSSPLQSFSFSPWLWLYLGGMSLLVYHSCLSILFLNPDDDFWLHAPMQAQLLKGNFPIRNPVFPELFYGGHYARDLSVVAFSWWSGIHLYASQTPITVFFQVLSFWLILAAGLRFGGSVPVAVLSSFCIFVGVNAAGRGGWLDTLSNNNGLAQMHTALLVFLVLKVLFEKVPWSQVAGVGFFYAGLAWSYETSFVSFSLSLLLFAFIVLAKRKLETRQLKVAVVLVVTSLVFLVWQGGIFGDLFHKLIKGGPVQELQTDLTTQTQNLEVSVKFPKKEMLKIKLVRAGDEISMAYHTFPWFKQFDITPQEPGYVSVFSSAVFRIHWLALYLCPFTLVFLWRRENFLGLLYWGYGLASYLIPAVIDFGLWEIEVFRWQYAASWGFAGALGVVLGSWWQSDPKPALSWQRDFLVISKGNAKALAVFLVLFLNSYPSWVQIQQRREQLPHWQWGWLMPSSKTWLAYHPVLNLASPDIEAGLKLAEKVETGQTLLMSRRAGNHADILEESAWVGLCGPLVVGHSFPLQKERLGTTPFRQSTAAIAFWQSGDPQLLANWSLDWLFLKEKSLSKPPAKHPSLQEVIRVKSKAGDRVVFSHSAKEFPKYPYRDRWHDTIRITTKDGAYSFVNEEYRLLEAEIAEGHTSKEPHLLSYRVFDKESGKLLSYEEGFTQEVSSPEYSFKRANEVVPPGTRVERVRFSDPQPVLFHFVSPHNPGHFLIKLYLADNSEFVQVGEFDLKSQSEEVFSKLKVEWKDPSQALAGGVVTDVSLQFTNAAAEIFRFKGMVSLTAQVPGPSSQGRDFQHMDFELAPGESRAIKVKVVPPFQAGTWPFSLLLNPKDAVRTFDLGEHQVVF